LPRVLPGQSPAKRDMAVAEVSGYCTAAEQATSVEEAAATAARAACRWRQIRASARCCSATQKMPTIVENLDEESVDPNTNMLPDIDSITSAGSDDLRGLCSSGGLELPLAQASNAKAGRVQSILARLQELQVEEEEEEEFEGDEGDEVMLGKSMTSSLSRSTPPPPESTCKDVEDAETVVHDGMMCCCSGLPRRVPKSSCEVSVQVEASDLGLPHSMQTSLAYINKQLQDMHLQFVSHVEARFKQHLANWKSQIAKEVETQLSSKLDEAALLDARTSHLATLLLPSEAFEAPRVRGATGVALDFSPRHDSQILPTPNLDTEAAIFNSFSDVNEHWDALSPTSHVADLVPEVQEEMKSIGVGLHNEIIPEVSSDINCAMLQEPACDCNSTDSRAVMCECSTKEHLLYMEDILGELLTAGGTGNNCQLLQRQHAHLSCTMTSEQQPGPPTSSFVVKEHSLETAGEEFKLDGCIEAWASEDVLVETLQKPVCTWFALSPRAQHRDALAEPSFGEFFACEPKDAAGLAA